MEKIIKVEKNLEEELAQAIIDNKYATCSNCVTWDELNSERKIRGQHNQMIFKSLSDIAEEVTDLIKNREDFEIRLKDNKDLLTKQKDYVGAINELKTTTDGNTTLISKNTEANNELKLLKQDKVDSRLGTVNKDFTSAINEIKALTDLNNNLINKNTSSIAVNSGFITRMQDVTKDGNTTEGLLALKNSKQDKNDEALTTTNKSVIGAINELNSRMNIVHENQIWLKKGRSTSAKKWDHNLIAEKKYRVSYNWGTEPDLNDSIVYKEFIFKGHNIELETFIEGATIRLEGTASIVNSINIAELSANNSGINILAKAGVIKAGRIVNFEELQ